MKHRQRQKDRQTTGQDPRCCLLKWLQNNDNDRKTFPLHTILKQLALLVFISLQSLEIFSKHDSAASSLILLTRSVSSNTVLHTSAVFLLHICIKTFMQLQLFCRKHSNNTENNNYSTSSTKGELHQRRS